MIVVNDLRLGGAERQALLLAEGLAGRGADVVLAAFDARGPVLEHSRRRGITCAVTSYRVNAGLAATPWNLLRLRGFLRRLRPDVLLPFTAVPNAYCCMLWRGLGARACIWNQRDAGLPDMNEHLLRIASRKASLLVANSRSGLDYMVDTLRTAPGTTRVIHNGVELPAGEPAQKWRDELGVKPADRLACMIGKTRTPKDHETLLRAWSRVVQQVGSNGGRPVLLLLSRPSGREGELRVMCHELGISEYVIFAGFREDVYDILRACHLGVFSSRSEGLPNGVLECMACALPVVATDLAGVRECLDDSQHRLLAPPGEAEAMANHITGLLRDPDRARAAGAANRARIEREFSVDAMTQNFVNAIAKVLEQ